MLFIIIPVSFVGYLYNKGSEEDAIYNDILTEDLEDLENTSTNINCIEHVKLAEVHHILKGYENQTISF